MASLGRPVRLLNVRQLEEFPIGPLECFCGAARIAVARPEEITWIRVGQRSQLVANFVRDDDINSYACLGAIEEDLVVAILVRREPLSFQRGGVEDGESRPAHQQSQGAEALPTMLIVIATSVLVLVRCCDDLLELFGQEVVGWHDIRGLRLFECIHRILAEHVVRHAEGEEGVHALVLAMRGCLAVIPGGPELGQIMGRI